MRSKTSSLLILVVGMATGVALTVGQGVFADGGAETKAAAAQSSVPVDDLRKFVEILNEVKQGYVEKVSDKTLIENAIRGMVDRLDPHSAYLSPEQFKQLTVSTSGRFGGLGIEVSMQNGFVRVISPIDDTPAAKAGIEAGDLILRINDTAVKGLELNDAVKLMRGKPGSKITLTILREGKDAPFKLTLKRAIIHVQSVKSRLLEPGYGYVRISEFSDDTGKGLHAALKKLRKKSGGPLRGLVLDLRNNPGGVLSAAVTVVDTFVNSGPIVSIKGRSKSANQVFSATAGDMLDGKPMAVLVNEGSASASEIVAGALQDDKRAVIMGRRTFGKGSVQTILPLQDNAALKITTARYFTPSGRSIQAEGIAPDIKLPDVKVTSATHHDALAFSESNLVGALSNPDQKDKANSPTLATSPDTPAAKGKPLAERDYGVYEALNLLKGMRILGPVNN